MMRGGLMPERGRPQTDSTRIPERSERDVGDRCVGMIQVTLGTAMKARIQRIADDDPACRGNLSAAVRMLLSGAVRSYEEEMVLRGSPIRRRDFR